MEVPEESSHDLPLVESNQGVIRHDVVPGPASNGKTSLSCVAVLCRALVDRRRQTRDDERVPLVV